MDTQKLNEIQSVIGYSFKNSKLLEQAFIRSSYSKEHPEVLDNEQLEFYGDEALDFYISKIMCSQFSEITKDGQFFSRKTEQELTEIKSYNVDTENLAHCISILGFQNYLIMSESDIKNNVHNVPSVMADLFEAIIGAVVIDSEWNIEKISTACRNMLKLSSFDTNYIKWLYNWCAECGYQKPVFRPKLNFLVFQTQNQYMYGGLYNFGRSFSNDSSEVLGATLYLKELNIRTESEIHYQYAAMMDCAKKAYQIIKKMKMQEMAGEPEFETAITQLNVLYQKGYISEPKYFFEEKHDENGNPVWHCDCNLKDLEDTFCGESSIKKEAKKEAAYGTLCEILGYESGKNDDYEDEEYDYE